MAARQKHSTPFLYDEATGLIVGLKNDNGLEHFFPSRVVASTSIPVILAPNGTVATNGTVTLGTALPVIFPYAWLRLPANAVVNGAAGLYYATFTSTTVGQVYTAFVDPTTADFNPFIPTTLVNAVGSNSAYTQTTGSDVILTKTTLPGGALGNNGFVNKTTYFINNNSAGSKTMKVGINGGLLISIAATTNPSVRSSIVFQNMGDQAHQSAFPSLGSFSATGSALTLGTTDTSGAFAVVSTGQLATATDWCAVVQNRDDVSYAS